MSKDYLSGNFIEDFMRWTENTESSGIYTRWAAISAIGAVVGRQVSLQLQQPLYPNTFVVLVGRAAMRKSTAISFVKKIVREVPSVNITGEALTREKLIQLMEEYHHPTRDESNGYIMSSEFSNLVTTGGNNLLVFMTDIFNAEEETFRYQTKNRGDNEIRRPILSMIGATTPSFMGKGFPAESVDDGFGARVVFVYRNRLDKIIAYPDPLNEDFKNQLIEQLTAISNIHGVMRPSEAALKWYSEWYGNYMQVAQDITDARLESYFSRKTVHLQKIAMIHALARGSKEIIQRDFTRALTDLEEVESQLAAVFQDVGSNPMLSVTERIIEMVAVSDRVPINQIYESFSHRGGKAEIDGAIELAVARGRVKTFVGDGIYLVKK